jgi:murein DD-endopeptidase MepM/ murein hydrolase activator NlpD
MPNVRVAGVVSFAHRLFPHRQFYLRTRGSVQFFELSPAFQITVSIGAVFAVLWIVYASVVVVFKEQLIAAKNSRYANMREAYNAKVVEMQKAHDELSGILVLAEERFQNATHDLALRHRQMTQLLMKKQEMAKRLREVRRRVVNMSDYRGPSRMALSSPDGANALMMQDEPGEPAPRRSRVPQSIGDSTIMAIQVSLQGQTKNAVVKNIGLLEQRLGVLQKQQLALLNDVQESVAGEIEQYARIVKIAGLPMPDGSQDGTKASPNGEGGAMRSGPLDLRFEHEFGELEDAFDKLDGLTTTLSRAPLVTPILSGFYSSTSGYGNRIDPFSGRYAFHAGADLASAQGTSVLASAAGVVLAAEKQGAYGNMVEINHGYGIKTRYGHLQTILVRPGQAVSFHQKIGTVGSTGRSTGPHLHYEIWVGGVTRDPTKFFDAGRRVYTRQ